MKVTSLDHLVLTVTDIPATVAFYTEALGMEVETFHPADGTTRYALTCGAQKINLHQLGNEFEPKAAHVQAGSGDLCFLTEMPVADWMRHLEGIGISVEEGPVSRTGATGPLLSIYLRDPDGNLIEVSNRL